MDWPRLDTLTKEPKAMTPSSLRLSTSRANLLASACLASALALAGCGSDSVSGPKQVPLTVKAMGAGSQASPANLASGLALQTAYSAAAESIPVTYTKALLVVRDVRFHFEDGREDTLDTDDGDEDSTGIEDSTGMDEDHGEGGEGMIIYRGPFVIDLLASSAESLGTQLVPPGDYDRVQGHLRALQGSDWNARSYGFLVGATVYLEGVVEGDGGGPFTYKARIDDEFMIRGRFTVASGTPATAFITFDLSKWLLRDGQFLDPRNPDNASWIEWAIRHAIKVGMDGDHDGHPDDE
jgi:hypothetical protein